MTCKDSCPVFGLFAAIIGVVASAAVITIFGINIVNPYMITRGFKPAECIVESVERLNVTRKCRCDYEGGRCDVIHALCVVVGVQLNRDFATTRHGMLYASDQSLSFDLQCSFPTCWSYENYDASDESYDESDDLEDFIDTYPIGANVSCFVDTKDNNNHHRAIGDRHISKTDVFHALVWPLSVFLLGIICAMCSFRQLEYWERKYNALHIRQKP